MDRRSFLTALATGAAALAFDPERLLWTPGAKTIFIPKPSLRFVPKYYTVNVVISGPLFEQMLKARVVDYTKLELERPFGFALADARPE